MIELHERLSEFSYGYGVTREVEILLQSIGLSTTPFLPSLIHENKVGYDVKFNRPGTPLLLQFKLGQEMMRFRSDSSGQTPPNISRPFWRFRIDTTEAQFKLLLDTDRHDAEVFYVAPRFSNWGDYEFIYQNNQVLNRSLLIRPGEIERGLAGQNKTAGKHRIIYDRTHLYVCSEPIEIDEVSPETLGEKIRIRVAADSPSLGKRLAVLMESSDRIGVRRSRIRQEWVDDIRRRASSDDAANAALLGFEAWTLGAQMIFVTRSTD